MSLIIKSHTGREVEIPRSISLLVKTLGIEEEMNRDDVIGVLNTANIHAIAKGHSDQHQALVEAVEELSTWNDETVHIDL